MESYKFRFDYRQTLTGRKIVQQKAKESKFEKAFSKTTAADVVAEKSNPQNVFYGEMEQMACQMANEGV